jgi:hypothetical protein
MMILEYIRPICLPTTLQGWDNVNFDGTSLIVIGWGRTNNNKYSGNNKL